jgi:hypothetical protein
MATCPECNATIGQTDVQCSACGYDFPEGEEKRKFDLAYSKLADVSLAVGAIAALLGCGGAIFGGFVAAADGRFWDALFLGPVAFFLCFAMVVVFVRVGNA